MVRVFCMELVYGMTSDIKLLLNKMNSSNYFVLSSLLVHHDGVALSFLVVLTKEASVEKNIETYTSHVCILHSTRILERMLWSSKHTSRLAASKAIVMSRASMYHVLPTGDTPMVIFSGKRKVQQIDGNAAS